ncbi:MAG: hypothetical protein ACXWZ8_07650, partial [Gaiellaceae bacterium]
MIVRFALVRTVEQAPSSSKNAIDSCASRTSAADEEREVIRDAGAYGTETGDDDSSHCSSSLRSSSASIRSGRRT